MIELRWTTEVPTVTGWYWQKRKDGAEWVNGSARPVYFEPRLQKPGISALDYLWSNQPLTEPREADMRGGPMQSREVARQQRDVDIDDLARRVITSGVVVALYQACVQARNERDENLEAARQMSATIDRRAEEYAVTKQRLDEALALNVTLRQMGENICDATGEYIERPDLTVIKRMERLAVVEGALREVLLSLAAADFTEQRIAVLAWRDQVAEGEETPRMTRFYNALMGAAALLAGQPAPEHPAVAALRGLAEHVKLAACGGDDLQGALREAERVLDGREAE